MKNAVIPIIILLFTFPIFSEDQPPHYEIIREYMLARGYSEFNPQDEFYLDIFRIACTEILGDKYVRGLGIKQFFMNLSDGLRYCFLFILALPELPNIMVTMVYEGKGFYKINYELEGEEFTIKKEGGGEDSMLLFY